MPDTCSTTVHKEYKGAMNPSVLKTVLKYPAISKLLVISSPPQLPDPAPTGYMTCVTDELTPLIVKCLAVPLLYVEAHPIDLVIPSSNQLVDTTSIIPKTPSSSDTCIFRKRTLTICLCQQSYSQSPSVLNIPHVTVKKISQLKSGHGSRDMVAYHHSITVKFSEKDALIPAPVAWILDTIFETSAITLTTSSTGEFASIVGPTIKSTCHYDGVMPLDVSIDIDPLFCKPSYVRPDVLAPVYEYLCLLHRQSKQLQHGPANDYISTYNIPRCPNMQQWKRPLVQTRIRNTHPQILSTLLDSNWILISLQTKENFNVMLLRDEDNGVLSYEVRRSQY